ncbi:hypothetical protein Aduo_010087 [Ancylostoma duodenale]
MRSLITLLALCVLVCAHRCPKTSEIKEEDIKSVHYVANVTVTMRIGNFYHLMYQKYFDVPNPATDQAEVLGTVSRQECYLNVGVNYILGCKRTERNNHDCFARPSEQLSPEEKELLKITV